MIKDIATDVLLGLAVVVVLLSALAIAVMDDVYQKLHYLSPISVVAPLLVAAAVLVRSGFSEQSVQTWLTLGLLVVASPYLGHATLRTARYREDRARADAGAGRRGADGAGEEQPC